MSSKALSFKNDDLETLMADSMPNIVWTATPDGAIDFFNRRWYEFTGGNPVDGPHTREEIIHPDDLDRARATWDESIRTGKPYEIEFRYQDRVRGGYRWFLGRAIPVRDRENKIVKWYGSSVDINDQKLAQQDLIDKERRLRQAVEETATAIQNERENFRNLFKQTPEMVCILTGPEHVFEFVNEAHVRVLGFDATGMAVRKAQPESVEVHCILDEVYRTGKTAELTEIPVTVTNRLRYFNLTYAARRDLKGIINGIMILGLEVTNEVLARAELKAAKDEAERQRHAAEAANESKSRFLANMSHEIRTPLSAILGYSELLKGQTKIGNSEAASQLDRISRNASQLGHLIDELLDLSKIEAEKFEVELTDFDLATAIEDTLASVSLLARQKGLQFETKRIGDVPRLITTDQTRFKQILTNIIGNAVKFTESGRVDVEFEKIDERGKHYLQVRVTDTGIGLTPEQGEKLFETFVQADSSITRKFGGTGLGLVLARRLARLLGGDLNLEKSALGKGSTFLLKIEIGLPAQPAPKTEAHTKSRADRLDGARVLIVDDSTDNQTIMRLFLTNVGAAVELANNGLEAVEAMKLNSYDVVLMDIQMPMMDGYQALKVAKQNGYGGPILALTAHALKEERDRCIAAGFTDYMSKPINRTTLIARLSELVSG